MGDGNLACDTQSGRGYASLLLFGLLKWLIMEMSFHSLDKLNFSMFGVVFGIQWPLMFLPCVHMCMETEQNNLQNNILIMSKIMQIVQSHSVLCDNYVRND